METIVLERVVPSVFAADPKAVEGSEIWLREVTFRRDQTLRFTLGFDLDGIKDLFGRRRR